MLNMPGVERVVGHMCEVDMKQSDKEGIGSIMKPTGFMTNSWHIARRLEVKCKNRHRHIMLMVGRAKMAEVYPDKLCEQVMRFD